MRDAICTELRRVTMVVLRLGLLDEETNGFGRELREVAL